MLNLAALLSALVPETPLKMTPLTLPIYRPGAPEIGPALARRLPLFGPMLLDGSAIACPSWLAGEIDAGAPVRVFRLAGAYIVHHQSSWYALAAGGLTRLPLLPHELTRALGALDPSSSHDPRVGLALGVCALMGRAPILTQDQAEACLEVGAPRELLERWRAPVLDEQGLWLVAIEMPIVTLSSRLPDYPALFELSLDLSAPPADRALEIEPISPRIPPPKSRRSR